MNSYDEIQQFRHQQMTKVSNNHERLNHFHDQIIDNTVKIAMDKVEGEWGIPPAPFAFFLMGSAGRFEQSVWSDQDHGIIFDGSDDCQAYFLRLGSEITNGLTKVGYELCDGNVMASNSIWCQSIERWEIQVERWLLEAKWDSLRHFLTFFDSRVLIGETTFLDQLKNTAFSILQEKPHLYIRLVENVSFVKKGIGAFGQLLPELKGEHSGSIQLKQTTFFPYVNALRLLALKDKIVKPSTLSRFGELSDNYPFIKRYEEDFKRLLDFRLYFRRDAKSYEEVHHIPVSALTKGEKQELKEFMKKGYKLFSETKTIVEKECSTWL
ncbi:DUF294 nucleotidyltransferase-like domain-containing protein [Aquibacillus rhizosphaerae]|uniref:DUF294 nucleotidyltransferase-like domain-containing protein n=1 Tax=Aquibacillus rhizosphaerae TaxID=3051431 RepID=A0ABT7L9D8_9BACI|nr:DUF294 nucleotidyltransferase-like domain-containing protein [Aquibacillus sp. LR5S19]MDL4841191.1 DUF294 nucleotidyltransferase-like domain-containing protein [Aquibacillus sp. LR5S19]